MAKNIKDLILSGFLSLSKAEQDILKEVINTAGQDVQHEQQVRKQEIKIISRKRFNEILDRADEFLTMRDKERLTTLMEQRGFSDSDISFKNTAYQGIYGTVGYKFKTDNALYKFANNVVVKTIPLGRKELWFYINTVEHASVNVHYEKLAGLTYFQVEENRNNYEYQVLAFSGVEKKGYDLILKYIADVVVDGVHPLYEDEEERVMTKRDLVDKPNTYTLGSQDFLLNG
jgi:hypothetical protein